MRAAAALSRLLSHHRFTRVLDVGSGPGEQAEAFRAAGKLVTTNDLRHDSDISGDFLEVELVAGVYDLVWMSHFLEHQRNVGAVLEKAHRLLPPGGILAVTVPPMKPEIVGGHLTLWNAGLLLYNLILAGFDCRAAEVYSEGYDVSVIVLRGEASAVLPELHMDAGDIELLAEFFPVPVRQGFSGDLKRVNWT